MRFRKGTVNEKDIFVEVWKDEQGFVSSLKVTDKLKLVYNDAVFGGMQWSRDGTKITFIGEKPEIATYKPFFKDEEEPKKEEDKKEDEEKKENDKKPEEEKPEEHWQDEKFLYKENFGETLTNKERPAIFIFDTVLNKLHEVQFGKHLKPTDYP